MSEENSQSIEQSEAPGAFADEFREYWGRLPDKGLFFGLAIPWLLMFQGVGNSTLGYGVSASLYDWMADIYKSPFNDESHGFLIPFVVLYLFWWKREELDGVEKRNWAPGLAILAIAAALHVVGFAGQQARLSVISLFLGLYGIMGIAWGMGFLRASFFPVVLFVFCMPLGSLTEGITVPLRLLVTKASVWAGVHLLNIDVVHDGSRILGAEGAFQYDVAPACSGIRSLTALMILTTIVSFVALKGWWRRLALIVAAPPVAIAGNVLRITAVIIAGQAFGQDAGGKVHDHAWILTWGLALACMGGLYGLLVRDSAVETEPSGVEEDS